MRNLIALATVDGRLDEGEIALILKIGKARGLKEWQIQTLLDEDHSKFEIFLPDAVNNRMNLLYDFMQIIYADGLVSTDEVSFIRVTLEKFNFRTEIADHLIDLFQYGKPSQAEWDEFVDYINRVFVNQE